MYIFRRRGNWRVSRQAKKRACLLFPRWEWRNLPCQVPRQPNKKLDEENNVFCPLSFSVVCTRPEASYTRPSFSAKNSKKLAGRYFLPRKPVVCTFSRKLSRKFSISSTGVSNWLVEFLVGLVSDEKLERVYAKKPTLAHNKV